MTLANFNQKARANAPYFNNGLESLFNDLETKNSIKDKVPSVNISEKDGCFLLDLAAPGLRKEDFLIKLKKNILTVTFDGKEEKRSDDQKFSRKEFCFNSFSRSFNLPENADVDKISAAYLDGILTIKIGKQDEKLIQKEIAVS
ncbi:HSP20 family protein [Pedobacter sp. UYEF25]